MKLISAIVTVYNAEDTLERCADSILTQELPEGFSLELILVDDGSPDGSGAICDRYRDNDDRVRVVHQENGGLIRAWMAGVAAAGGEFFFFVDSDDWIDQGMLYKMASAVKSEGDGGSGELMPQIICTGALEEHSGGRVIQRPHGVQPGEYCGERLLKEIKYRILGNTVRTVHFSRCMKLTTAPLIRNNLHYCDPSIRMGEDMSIMLPALLDAERLVILPDSYDYHYTYNDASMAHGYDPGMNESTVRLLDIVSDVLRDRSSLIPPEKAESMLGRERSNMNRLELRNEFRNDGPGQAKRIKSWAAIRDSSSQLARYPVEPEGMADRLLMYVMRHPNTFSILAAGAIYKLWGKVKK